MPTGESPRFLLQNHLYLRLAIQSGAASLSEFLARAETQVSIRVAYPGLSEKIYPFEPAKARELLADQDLSLSLQSMMLRAETSTVPLGTFVAVAKVDKIIGPTNQISLELANLSVHFTNKEPPNLFGTRTNDLKKMKLLQTNPMLFIRDREVRYLNYEPGVTHAKYDWSVIPSIKTINHLLEFFSSPRTPAEFSAWLSKQDIAAKDSEPFLKGAIQNGLIISNLFNDRFTMRKIEKKIDVARRVEFAKTVDFLSAEKHFLPSRDAVVVAKPKFGISISDKLLADIALASELIATLNFNASQIHLPIERLKNRFHEEYDTAAVPIMELLDPFKNAFGQPVSATRVAGGAVGLPDFISQSTNDEDVILMHRDVNNYLRSSAPPALRLPAFATSVFFGKTNGKQIDSAWIRKVFCGANVRPMGRFLRYFSDDAKLNLPPLRSDFIWAEIGGGPQTKNRDLFELKLGGHYYIDCYNTPRRSEKRITLAELYVVQREGCLFLWSSKLNKFILPLQSNSVNQLLDANPAGILLSQIASQFMLGDLVFPRLAEQNLVASPRLRIGNVVVAPARWTILKEALREDLNCRLTASQFSEKHALRGNLFAINDSGRELLLDLNRPHAMQSLKKTLSPKTDKKTYLEFVELPRPEECFQSQFDGQMLNSEFILPFTRNLRDVLPKVAFPNITPAPSHFGISLKIYATNLGQNCFLKHVEKVFKAKRIPWFFLRSGTLGGELRLRIILKSFAALDQTTKLLNRWLRTPTIKSLIRNWAVEEYKPETAVYTFVGGIDLYHKLSVIDSAVAISILKYIDNAPDPALRILTAAWLSSLTYAACLQPRPQKIQRSKLFQGDRKMFYRAKSEAIKLYERSANEKLGDIYRTMDDELKALRSTFLRLSQASRDFLHMRMVHLSLNRLHPGEQMRFETLMANESVHLIEMIKPK